MLEIKPEDQDDGGRPVGAVASSGHLELVDGNGKRAREDDLALLGNKFSKAGSDVLKDGVGLC